MLIHWLVVQLSIQLEVGVGGLSIYSVTQ